MRNKNLFKKLLAAALIVAMAIPAVYLGAAKETVEAAAQKDLLKVVAQSTQTVVDDETSDFNGKYVLRFTSTVSEADLETVDYVGFEITDGTQTFRSKTTNVFTRIDASESATAFTYSPKVVDADSAYFFTAKWEVAVEDVAELYTVRAFAMNKDADEFVYGPARIVSVNDAIGQTALVAFPTTEEVTEAYIGEDAVAVAGQTDENVFVRVPRAGLQSVNNLTITDAEGAEIASTTYRYYGNTAYTGADKSWYDAAADAYYLATPNDLFGFAALVEGENAKTDSGNNLTGKTVYLVSDITLNTGNATDWTATSGPANKWTGIGGDGWSGTRFNGTFDGQGHTISGLYAVAGTGYSSGNYCASLFENVGYNAVIKNFRLVNSYCYTPSGYVGSISGNATGGTFQNIYSSAIVDASNGGANVGGFVGESRSDNPAYPATFSQCWFDGSVIGKFKFNNGASKIGAFVGAYYSAGAGYELSFTDCLITGTVQNLTADAHNGYYVGFFQNCHLTFTRCVAAGSYVGSDGSAYVGLYGPVYGSASIDAVDCYSYPTWHSNDRAYPAGYHTLIKETTTRINLEAGDNAAEKAASLLATGLWAVDNDGILYLKALAR